MTALVVTAWHREAELADYCTAWGVGPGDPRIVFQWDSQREGCGATKNKGVKEAVRRGADVAIVLDGDCYPTAKVPTLDDLIERHVKALEPQTVGLFKCVTDPPSRGTPYVERATSMPVAASMGFWTGVPDYCAVRQLAFNARPMTFHREPVHGKYFPLCGMNLAFKPKDWWPWCQFIEVSRYDDIWQGWLWMKRAYQLGYCFNLGGPIVTHSRQSNVWANLKDEALYAQETETLWRDIEKHPTFVYADLLKLLPTGTSALDVGLWRDR